jgi:hypothetical protein
VEAAGGVEAAGDVKVEGDAALGKKILGSMNFIFGWASRVSSS